VKNNNLKFLGISDLLFLRKNPQYLTPKQMGSLKKSIEKDGFLAPILVRPIKGNKFEIISGNHRAMAAQELGLKEVPCVIAKMTDHQSRRIAINLNTVHGDPPAELLAPFLAELDDITLSEIYLDADITAEIIALDKTLKKRLDLMELPDFVDRDSLKNSIKVCTCPICGRKHFETEKEKSDEV
jgi:ParB/RepB/Spo0J family partition protein